MILSQKILAIVLLVFIAACKDEGKKKTPNLETESGPVIMDLNMPKDEPGQERTYVQNKKAFTAILIGNDSVYCYMDTVIKNGRYYSVSDTNSLRPYLQAKSKEAGKDFVVIIKPAESATYANTVNMLDEMGKSNIERYVMVQVTNKEARFLHISISPDDYQIPVP